MISSETVLIVLLAIFYFRHSGSLRKDSKEIMSSKPWERPGMEWPKLQKKKRENTSFYLNTVKPVLSGHRIKRTPSIERTVAEVPKFISLIYFKWNLY